MLVYLIESAEMSIYDIRISEITSQYLAYIEQMQEQDVQVGTEFMVLAATLIDIKSRMLLPRLRPDGEPDGEDPRAELAERLAEYTKYRRLAGALEMLMDAAALKIAKPGEDLLPYTGEPDIFLKMDMDDFVSAFSAFLYKRQKNEELLAMGGEVGRQRISVAVKKRSIRSLLAKAKEKILRFRDLLTNGGSDRSDKVTTFISLLDMARDGVVGIEQSGSFQEIEVRLVSGRGKR